MPDETNGFPTEVITAFVVALTPDGRWVGSGDPSLLPSDVVTQREAHLGDLIAGGHMVSADADRQITINRTVTEGIQAQVQMANQLRQSQENSRVAQSLIHPGQGRLF